MILFIPIKFALFIIAIFNMKSDRAYQIGMLCLFGLFFRSFYPLQKDISVDSITLDQSNIGIGCALGLITIFVYFCMLDLFELNGKKNFISK